MSERSEECLDEQSALAFLEDRMPAPRRTAVDRHVDGCSACRRYLSAMALVREAASAPPPVSAPVSPASIDRYTVVAEHARGGQARVMIAFDQNVGREVALKELLPREAGDPVGDASWRDATARFLREAELTGQLVHPGIAPVFEIGQRPDGTLFYTMQLVSGRTFSEVLRARPAPRERIELLSHFVSVCHVVAYAHSRGVLHRDLKPQNIMIGDFGETVLLDWGLAKQHGEPESGPLLAPRSSVEVPDHVTRQGTVVGTPGYMSPEQAAGDVSAVDERSDIYGLGAVLFEILTGKPPPAVRGPAVPTPPAQVRAHCAKVPPELASVAEKALALSKVDRYQRAAELAQDVTAFMTGSRVGAYSYSSWDLVRRFAARHRWLLAAAAISFATISVALVLTSVAWRSELKSRQSAEQREQAAAAREREALQEGARLALAQGDALQARAKLRGALELGDSLEARALWRSLRANSQHFVAHLGSAAYGIGFSPDGRTLAVGTQNATVQLLDTLTRAGRTLRAGSDQIAALAFPPGGQELVLGTGGGRVVLWDFERRALIELPQSGGGELLRAFSMDAQGSLLAARGKLDEINLWSLRSRTLSARLKMPTRRVMSVALSADGRRLVVSGEEGKAAIWDVATHKPLVPLSEDVDGVAFSPDGTWVAGGGYRGEVFLWRAADGKPAAVLRGHEARIPKVAMSPDGRTLASASVDGTVRLWKLPEGELLRVFPMGGSSVREVAFSADSRRLAASAGTAVWVWDLMVPEEPEAPRPPLTMLNTGRFSPDGSRIATAGEDGLVRLWDTASGQMRSVLSGHQSLVSDVCFSANGELLVSAGNDGLLLIRDGRTGAVRHRLWLAHEDRFLAVDCAPDSIHVATGGVGGSVRVWNALTGNLARLFPGRQPQSVFALRYSPDGRWLVAGRRNGAVEVWETASGRLVRSLEGHAQAVWGVAFDATGRALATGSFDRSLRLWSMASGKGRSLGESAGRIHRLAWAGAETIAAPTSTGEIELHDLTGAPPVRIKAHAGEANSVAVAPGGAVALSTGDDGTLRLWETATWRPRWLARAMVWAPGLQLLTHTGWHTLDAITRQIVPLVPEAAAWRQAAETAREATGLPGGPVCMVTESGLEIWETQGDRRVGAESLEHPFEVAALPGGCSVLKEGRARLYRPGAAPVEIAAGASFQSGGEALAVVGAEVRLHDALGRVLGSFGPGADLTAAVPAGPGVVVGYRDGALELRTGGGGLPVVFQQTPGRAVTRLAAGPKGIVAAGFADGSFGVWSFTSGARLVQGGVHGPVRFLTFHGEVLVAASEVGAMTSLDLRLLTVDDCEVLREVWSRVPVLWSGQGAVVREPDRGHRCGAMAWE